MYIDAIWFETGIPLIPLLTSSLSSMIVQNLLQFFLIWVKAAGTKEGK